MTGLRELRRRAEDLSGVPYSAVEAAKAAKIYESLGYDMLHRLSEAFYRRVYGNETWFRSLFANTTRAAAIQNQVEFLTQEFGGPRLYEQRKGCTMLLGRHGMYGIDGKAAKRWLECMEGALSDVGIGCDDDEIGMLLMRYFRHMAWYVVVGLELVNGQRVVGYFGKKKEGEV